MIRAMKAIEKNKEKSDKFGGPVIVVTNGKNRVSVSTYDGELHRLQVSWQESRLRWKVLHSAGVAETTFKFIPDNAVARGFERIFDLVD